MRAIDLGTMPYRDAWAIQEAAHAEVLAGGEERVLIVEHPPAITFGRRPGVERNVIASDEQLAALGVEIVQSDRGGDVTFHGPGQIVAYPIVRLNDHGFSVGGYVRAIQDSVIECLAEIGIAARCEAGAVGLWVDGAGPGGESAKICAIGVRIRRGVTLHGLALNVTTDLRYFELIVPCGLRGRRVTSVQSLLGARAPGLTVIKDKLIRSLAHNLACPPKPFAARMAPCVSTPVSATSKSPPMPSTR